MIQIMRGDTTLVNMPFAWEGLTHSLANYCIQCTCSGLISVHLGTVRVDEKTNTLLEVLISCPDIREFQITVYVEQ